MIPYPLTDRQSFLMYGNDSDEKGSDRLKAFYSNVSIFKTL
jgi:hypothetical protein